MQIQMHIFIFILQLKQYKEYKEKGKVVDFDINLTRQRLERNKKQNIIQYSNTRRLGFRTKITPDNNEAAIGELRREIK